MFYNGRDIETIAIGFVEPYRADWCPCGALLEDELDDDPFCSAAYVELGDID